MYTRVEHAHKLPQTSNTKQASRLPNAALLLFNGLSLTGQSESGTYFPLSSATPNYHFPISRTFY